MLSGEGATRMYCEAEPDSFIRDAGFVEVGRFDVNSKAIARRFERRRSLARRDCRSTVTDWC